MDLEELLCAGYEAHASDIHLMAGRPVMFRINGTLQPYKEEDVTEDGLEEVLRTLLTKLQRKKLEQFREVEAAGTVFGKYRVRTNVFWRQGLYAVTIRLLARKIPKPKEIFLPSTVTDLLEERRGLILLAGESGCGKTTTAASLLNFLVSVKRKHVVTIENPVEYLIPQGMGIVFQREIAYDGDAYADAIRSAAHQDADVIFIGALTNEKTVSAAVTAAETGHLVIAAVHTPGAEDTLRWMAGHFSEFYREEMLRRLSAILKAVVAQQLVPVCNGTDRRAVFEVLPVSKEISMLIRDGRISQILSVMEKNGYEGMQTMDDALLEAYMKSVISAKTAVFYAFDRENMQQKMHIY